MAEGSRGWVGSVVVHLAILAAFVAASWWGARAPDALEVADPLLVTLDGIPGRKPGEVGRKEGVAKGSEKGSPLFRYTPLPPERVEPQPTAQPQPRAAAAASAAAATRGSTTAATSNRVSLDDFNRSRGQGRATGTANAVSGVSMGRATGTGDNGGDGGAASAQQLYAGQVLARFRDAWAEVVAAEGEDLGGLLCGVRVAVSASGQVTFSGWITAPSSAKAGELVRKAIARIGNCGPPPNSKAFTIDFTRVTAEGV
jgi:hypothetical protein